MKKYLSGIIFILAAILGSCEKGDGGKAEVTQISVTLNKQKILSNNIDKALAIITDQNGLNISEEVELYLDDTLITGLMIATNISGPHSVYAKYNNLLSNTVNIEAVEDIGLEFDKVVLVEQFTGTWCGYCPWAITSVDNLLLMDDDIVHVGYHLSDGMSYSGNVALFESFGYTGVPSLKVDRKIDWDGSIGSVRALHKQVRTGLSVSLGGSESMVDINVEVTFGILYTESLKLTVYLIEDKLVSTQANYYNDDAGSPWYQRGEVMYDFVHRNVMRKTVTDMFGDIIPASSIDIASKFETTFKTSPTWVNDIDNLKVVAIVSYASGNHMGEVINSLSCSFGSSNQSSQTKN